MPAAAKGAIDVDSVGADTEGSDGFFEKDRDMGYLTHGWKGRGRLGPGDRSSASERSASRGHRPRHSEKFSIPGGKTGLPPAVSRSSCCCQRSRSQIS